MDVRGRRGSFGAVQCVSIARPCSPPALKPNDAIRAVFEPDFELEYIVSLVDGRKLKTELRVHNPSSTETLPFQTRASQHRSLD